MSAFIAILWFIAIFLSGFITWTFMGAYLVGKMVGSKELNWSLWVGLAGLILSVLLGANHPF